MEKMYSKLKANKIVIDHLEFNRFNFRNKDEDNTTNFEFSAEINKSEESNTYHVSLKVTATKTEEYEAIVKISGFFEIEDSDPNAETFINENAIAILFPYVRSELTLLTSQPDTIPIILPVMNIIELLKDADEKETES